MGLYYIIALVYSTFIDLCLSFLCNFLETDFSTFTGAFSWPLAIAIVAFMLSIIIYYIMYSKASQKEIKKILPTRSFATSEYDLK